MRLSPRLYAKQLVVACLAEPQRVNELVNKFWQRIWLDKKFSWRKSIVQEVGSVWHELTRRAEVKVSARRQLHPVEQKFIGKEITKKLLFSKVLHSHIFSFYFFKNMILLNIKKIQVL